MNNRNNDWKCSDLINCRLYINFQRKILKSSFDEYHLRKLLIILMNCFKEKELTNNFHCFFCEGLKVFVNKWNIVEKVIKIKIIFHSPIIN